MKLSLIARVALVAATLGWASAASADLFVGTVNFVDNEDLKQDNRLYFSLNHVSWDGVSYQPETPTLFALEADFDGLLQASLILIQNSEFGQTLASDFPAAEDDAGFLAATLGSEGLSPALSQAMGNWNTPERAVVAWIIANSAELIQLATSSGDLNDQAENQWKKNATAIEQYLRRAEGPLKQMVTIASDKEVETRDLTLGYLGQLVQPALKNLGYYDGEVDGLWGRLSARAIRAFQRDLGALPTSYLSLDQIGQLQQAYGAGLTTQAALITPWASSIEQSSSATETAMSEVETLEAALVEQRKVSEDLSSAYDRALDNLTAIQTANSELEDMLAAQAEQEAARNQQLENQVANLTAQMETLTQDLAAQSAELAASAEAYTQLEEEAASDSREAEKLSELEEMVASLSADLDAKAEEAQLAEELENQLSLVNAELLEKKQQIEAFRTVESQLDDATAQLAAKAEENEALSLQLREAEAALPEASSPKEVVPAELLAKLQESSETIASLNAQLEQADEGNAIPLQRFTSVRDSLTQRVSMLNNMIVEERDNTTEYRNKWFAAQARLEEIQDACRADPACAEAMRLN